MNRRQQNELLIEMTKALVVQTEAMNSFQGQLAALDAEVKLLSLAIKSVEKKINNK